MKNIFLYLMRFIIAILILFLIWAALNLPLVKYGFSQLKGQLHIVMNARPMIEVLSDAAIPDSVKEKIRFIESVKKFAIDSLKLNSSENYTTFYDQKNKPLLWIVTACEPYKIKPYEWKFPWLGSVSYKGFFDYESAITEENFLKEQGFDTDLGEVSAWSTLGWFNDPILSNMLNRKKGQLAELIIHELTHATIYIKNNVNLNENLASACGELGAIRFLKSTYGLNSMELKNYLNQKDDYDRFSRQMLLGTQLLDSLYTLMNDSTILRKKTSKESLIKKIIHTLDTVSFHSPLKYKNIFINKIPNNTYFLDFIRYDAQKDEMKKKIKERFGENIKAYINYLALKSDSLVAK